jgi:hypothetical protein
MIPVFIGGALAVVLTPVLLGAAVGAFLKLWEWFVNEQEGQEE